jgi:hypothetical protein
MNQKKGNTYRIVAIVFMGLTAAMNVLGGAGTYCAAFSNNPGYKLAFKDLLDYRWLYQGLVVVTVILGIAGIWATVKLVRGGPTVYRNALILLVIGTILGGVHFFASGILRGKTIPANFKFYANVITLIIFLLLRLPSVREWVDFTTGKGQSDKATTGGVSSIVAGVIMLSTRMWVGVSHINNGDNWVDVLQTPLNVVGTILTVAGFGMVFWAIWNVMRQEIEETAPKTGIQSVSS